MENKNKEDDMKEYLQFLKRIRHEVEQWPDYKKVDGYVAHRWTLKPMKSPDKEMKDSEPPHPQIGINP